MRPTDVLLIVWPIISWVMIWMHSRTVKYLKEKISKQNEIILSLSTQLAQAPTQVQQFTAPTAAAFFDHYGQDVDHAARYMIATAIAERDAALNILNRSNPSQEPQTHATV